jgi:hypothetical protein
MSNPHTFSAAILRYGGHEIFIALVQPWILEDRFEAGMLERRLALHSQRPTVLAARLATGGRGYYGHPDLLPLIAKLPFDEMPWEAIPLDTLRPPRAADDPSQPASWLGELPNV